ncbi:MAG: hypothetical protein ACOCYU_00005, partial [Brevefilum sp.]
MEPLSLDLEALNIPQLGRKFNLLNRELVKAETAKEWNPAIAAMGDFLDVLDEKIISDQNVIAENHVDSSRAISMCLTLAALGTQYRLEQFKPKDEEGKKRRKMIEEAYIPASGELRKKAIDLAKKYFESPIFESLREAIEQEIFPLLETMDYQKDPSRWMPFRVVQIGNIYERLYSFRLRTLEPQLVGDEHQLGLLRMIYDRKYLRFGTSGVRGRWGDDFTERRARQVVQAVCDLLNDEGVPDYVGHEDLSGRKVVIGYDTRRNADRVAEWAAEVCLANGFEVEFANRDTPTPALVYYLTEDLPPED